MNRFTKQHVRWLLLASATALCTVLTVYGIRVSNRDPVLRESEQGDALFSMQGVQSVIHQGAFHFTVSATSLAVAPRKLLGPFRLGFTHVLTIHNATVEARTKEPTHQSSALSSEFIEHLVSSLTHAIDQSLPSLLPGDTRLSISTIVCEPLRILQQDKEQSRALFTAASCRSTFGAQRLVCRDGELQDQRSSLSFRTLTYDGESWRIQLSDGTRRIAKTLDGFL